MARENMTRQDWLDISEPRGDRSTNPLLNNLEYRDSVMYEKYPMLPERKEPSFMELIQSTLPEKDTIDVPGMLKKAKDSGILQYLLDAIIPGGSLVGKGVKAAGGNISNLIDYIMATPPGPDKVTFGTEGISPHRLEYIPPKPMSHDAINKLQDENTVNNLQKYLYENLLNQQR